MFLTINVTFFFYKIEGLSRNIKYASKTELFFMVYLFILLAPKFSFNHTLLPLDIPSHVQLTKIEEVWTIWYIVFFESCHLDSSRQWSVHCERSSIRVIWWAIHQSPTSRAGSSGDVILLHGVQHGGQSVVKSRSTTTHVYAGRLTDNLTTFRDRKMCIRLLIRHRYRSI